MKVVKVKPFRILILLIILIASYLGYHYGRSIWHPLYLKIRGKKTIEQVIKEVGVNAEARLKPYFDKASVSYPPVKVAILAFKTEKKIELWTDKDNKWVYIRTYPIAGASGNVGPKLREGDWQVPEGIYQISALNPNSSYHLSMKINYPNEYDMQKAKGENRSNLGGDIFIHGKSLSIGCIAIGDEPIEELFVLTDKIGIANIKVIISPNDMRQNKPIIDMQPAPEWVDELYGIIKQELDKYSKSYSSSR